MNYFNFVFSFVANPKLRDKLGGIYANRLSERSFLRRAKRSAGLLLFFKFRKDKRLLSTSIHGKKKIIFFVNSVNQWLSLKPIYELLEEHSIIAVLKTNETVKKLLPCNSKILEIDVRLPIEYLWKLPLFIINAIIYSPLFYYRHFDAVIENFGHAEIFYSIIKKNEPSSVVFSNDHLPLYRTLLWATKQYNAPTIYIQHAAVSEIFPALSFSLSFLDGKDSLDKYRIDSNQKIFVLGSPKIDAYFHMRRFNKTLKAVGICYGILDNIEAVATVINFLSNAFPQITIWVRPHPAETRQLELEKDVSVCFSNSKIESMLCFLSKVDFVIGGNSSFYIEATAMNVGSAYFSGFCSDPKINDYYGFVKKGMIKEISRPEELKTFIEKEYKKDVYVKAKYYCNSIGEAYEGTVPKIIAQKIFEASYPGKLLN